MSSTARDIRQQPFYWIDRYFLPTFGPQIGPHAIAVYNALVFRADRAGHAFPGLSDLSDLTGIKSKHTIRKALETLSKAGLISMAQRFNGVTYDSNEYYILPLPGAGDAPGVVQEMHQGGAGDAPGVVQEMHQGGAPDATYLQSFNNNHLNNNQLTTAAACTLPAAAASLLELHAVESQKLNGQAESMAAWLAYAMTQPGLKNPVGYAMTRLKRHEEAAEVFREIVNIEIEWSTLPKCAHYEAQSRAGYQGMPWYEELETVSDDALAILEELWKTNK